MTNHPPEHAIVDHFSAMKPPRRILMITDAEMGHATKHVRGLALCGALRQLGWQVVQADVRETSEDTLTKLAAHSHRVYLLKVASLPLIRRLKGVGATILFDLADALWMPIHQAAGWQDLDAILQLADGVSCDNVYVAQYAARMGKRVWIVPMLTHIERMDELRGQLTPLRDPIRLGWVGSRGTSGAIAHVRAVLERLASHYPNLELRVLGANETDLPPFRRLKVSSLETYSEDVMIREVLQMSIGLHPMPLGIEDYVIRGGMKAFLYMSAGIPPVCQKAGEPADVITDGITGMLAENVQEWYEKLDVLIRDESLRRRMGESARTAIRGTHTLSYVAGALSAALESMG